MTWLVRELTDKTQILSFLNTERLYAAYAIGDLEPRMFAQCTWAGGEQSNQLQALVLHYRGLKIPTLFMMGVTDGLRAILEEEQYPEGVYLTCRTEHLDMTRVLYDWDKATPMWRMALPEKRSHLIHRDCVRLTPAHADELTELYALGGGAAFSPMQMQHGVYYGIVMDDRLVAAAGTHLVSPTYGVGTVGNVFTHPDYRGRGYAEAATSAVTDELLELGISDIVLNVAQSNNAAIHIYEKIGFRRHCPFVEGHATRRQSNSSKANPHQTV